MRHVEVALPVIAFASFCFKLTLSIHLVPERTEVTYVNEKYVYNVSARVVRYGRRSAYYYNLDAGLKHTWGNNITIHLMFFEDQNNQFKRSFVEFHFKLCDLFHREQYFGKMFGAVLEKYGTSCPFSPGMYNFTNTTLPADKIPNILHFQKGKVELMFSQLPTEDLIAKLYTIFSIRGS